VGEFFFVIIVNKVSIVMYKDANFKYLTTYPIGGILRMG